MDPETRKMLEDTYDLSRENNKMLKKMHRTAVWGNIFRVIYWVIIVGASVGAYYYFQPVLEGLLSTYEGITSGIGGLGEGLPDLSGLLNSFNISPNGQ